MEGTSCSRTYNNLGDTRNQVDEFVVSKDLQYTQVFVGHGLIHAGHHKNKSTHHQDNIRHECGAFAVALLIWGSSIVEE